MLRKDPFLNNYHYHIYNRGVDKRNIFKNSSDYERFLSILEKFNTPLPVINTSRDSKKDKKNDYPLVAIQAYCLMPNHYHLIVEQLVDGGISKFLQKVMTGYTMYFNLKHERSGVLFQGKSKSKLVGDNDYLRWLKEYIALNPLDLHESGWKENGIKDERRAKEFLKSYKYKSEYDYAGCDLSDFVKELKSGEYVSFS